jgi:hypothetical protein
LDFNDDNGRGVIITGLPFPAKNELKVNFLLSSLNFPGSIEKAILRREQR